MARHGRSFPSTPIISDPKRTLGQPAATANPVIPVRYGQPILEYPQVLVAPQYQRFPYQQQGVAPSNPVIPTRTRLLSELRDATSISYSQFRSYLFFEGAPQPLVPPARIRQLSELGQEQPLPRSQFYPLVPFVSGVAQAIPTRYGRGILLDLETVLYSQFQSSVYFENPPLPQVPPVRIRQLWELSTEHPLPRSKFYDLVPFVAGGVAAANPVIGIRYGQGILEGPQALILPAYQRFPYFEQPANPPIYYRYGKDILVAGEAFVPPQYQRFPFVSTVINPANPVIGMRYGQDVLAWPSAFVVPQYQRFPYFQQPANPPVPFRYGQDILIYAGAFVVPHFQQYPFISTVPPPPANIVLPILIRRLEELSVERGVVRPFYYVFPYFNPTAPVVEIGVYIPIFRPRRGR